MNNKKVKNKNIKRSILIGILVFILSFSVISIIIIKSMFDDNFSRVDKKEFTKYMRYKDVADSYDRLIVTFKSGENTLTGYIYGEENTKGLVVISHGLGDGAEGYMPETLAFIDAGYRVFSFDNTGSIESEGKGTRGLSQSLIDLDAALTYSKSNEKLNDLPILLYGHSWGGYAVAAILNYDHDITASVSVSGYNTPMELLMEQGKTMMGKFSDIVYPYIWLYQKYLFGSFSNVSAINSINSTDTPVMIIHGSNDYTILYDGASIISKRDRITNPNVIYKVCQNENHDGHNNLFMSENAVRYNDELNEYYEEINNQYNGDIPTQVIKDFYAEVDKFKISDLDDQYISDVLSFYESTMLVDKNGTK